MTDYSRLQYEREQKSKSIEMNNPIPLKMITSLDFSYKGCDENIMKANVEANPCLLKGNFYIIHKHFNSPENWHYDARFQIKLANHFATWSICIPEGFSNFEENRPRLGIETPLHPTNYSLLEGKSIGVWDVGQYSIQKTKNAMVIGIDDDLSTNDEENLSVNEKQERKLRNYHTSCKFLTDRRGKKEKNPNHKEGRGMVIELMGKRWKNLRLRFFRNSGDFDDVTPRGINSPRRVDNWMVAEDLNGKVKSSEDFSIGDVSILSGRTIRGYSKAERDDVDSMIYSAEGYETDEES